MYAYTSTYSSKYIHIYTFGVRKSLKFYNDYHKWWIWFAAILNVKRPGNSLSSKVSFWYWWNLRVLFLIVYKQSYSASKFWFCTLSCQITHYLNYSSVFSQLYFQNRQLPVVYSLKLCNHAFRLWSDQFMRHTTIKDQFFF